MTWQFQLGEAKIGGRTAAPHGSKLNLVVKVCISVVWQSDLGVSKIGIATLERRMDRQAFDILRQSCSHARELPVEHVDPWRLGVSTTREDVAQWSLV